MNGKKSRLETYLDVLETVRSGESEPANIVCRCDLAWTSLRDVLASLAEQELIRLNLEESRGIFDITEKGRQLLGYSRKVKGFLTLNRSATQGHADSSLLQSRLAWNSRLSRIVIVNIVRYYYTLG